MKRLLYILSFLLALHHCNIISAQTSLEENSIIRGALDEMFEDSTIKDFLNYILMQEMAMGIE